MSAYWDFRRILNVYPESESFTCVAVRADQSTPCPNRRPLLSDMDLAEAAKILDNMDHCESLKASYDYLLDLAHLTLCIEHAESGLDQIAHISGRWQDKIILHMKKEVASTARPRTRRNFGRKRGPSQNLMGVLVETKEELVQSSAINVPSLTTKKTSKKGRPTRSMSTKISSLISEVGFHDPSNAKYKPSTTLRHAKTISQESMPRLLRRDTPTRAPMQTTQQDAELANRQLMSLLAKSESRLESRNAAADDVPTPTSATRERSGTTSSTGSNNTTSSKTSKFTESLDGSSPPTSRDSSAKTSPVVGATLADIRFFKPGDSFKLPPPSIKVQVPSPERPLPTFDFGIFTNLPLPPGHKEELSPKEQQFPNEWESEYKFPRLPILSNTFDSNSSATARDAQLMEKPLRKAVKKSKVSMKRTSSVKKQIIQHDRTASDESAVAMSRGPEKAPEDEIDQSESIDVLTAMVEEMDLLPEHESAEPIGTSWMSPLLRSSSSRKNSVKLARKPSRLSRTLSRKLSRSGSSRNKAGSAEGSPERVPIQRRQTEGPSSLTRQLSKKRETIPLEKLIKMSHELADKLDGVEYPGFVEVRPSSSYKYHLPRASEMKVEPVPDLRWSKLFTTQEPDAFLNESPFFRMAAKPVPSRSKSVGNVDDEIRKAHPGEEVSLPISQMKMKAVREEFPKMTVEAPPLGDVEVCPTCGNTQGIWGRCGCGSEEKETRRGSNGSGGENRLPAPMEQAPPVPRKSTMRRIRKRGMTLRRIRTRVVRALTV